MSRKVLLIEDDLSLQELIISFLKSYGFETAGYADPKKALDRLLVEKEPFDIVVLDLMLPGMDGFDVAKMIKSQLDIPIIISSARTDIGNKIYGYDLGADDYLDKPYEPRELVLRIEAVLRRYGRKNELVVSDFTIDETNKTVMMEGYPIDLTRIEFDIFILLIKNRGKNLSRDQIIGSLGLEDEMKHRTVDMHISNIRLKIGDDAKEPRYIKSVWGIGYKFTG
ncbi:two component transcriptional regulator, winged helix family [Sulfuricurvum kujiense DSM 16994]|uniref:Two component transcriptional regulator, winged helix family n=1 Tax=Sulfuricurvum kujiense (strain ATCC BAA-921 / DSM 16994 / JCM 11577 / YK-1) TaxID=709032 RepID=E4TZB5_SULKY|nr:response regulator transcription factor [Sulfuricurvum kujiense]ADR34130.1 two component transcriptional regulator, winged helix family [Sulfuricurvum kujiense DSM 16994]